jgi:hypothetical protein
MTNERPLAAISDEINRALDHLDAQAAARALIVDARFDRIDSRIDEVTLQVKTTNGRVTNLEMWRRYLDGVKAGAGGSWSFLIAGVGALVGISGVVVAIVSLT